MKVTCESCTNVMNVDESMRGKRGKCPKCKSLILVPEYDEDSLIFDDENLCGYYEQTRNIVDFLNTAFAKKILRLSVNTEKREDNTYYDGIILTIKTGEYLSRTQTGIIISELNSENVHTLYVSTSVGDVSHFSEDDYVTILKNVDSPRISVNLDSDDTLKLRSYLRSTINTLEDDCNLIISVLEFADVIEEKLCFSDDE